MGRFLECPWAAKKSMDVSPGAAKARKKSHEGRASARQEILLEKMAPGAHLARAQLINKLIKLINEKKRRIEFGDLTRHGPKGQANF